MFGKKKKLTEEQKKEALERLSKAFRAGGYAGGSLALADGYFKTQCKPEVSSSQEQ